MGLLSSSKSKTKQFNTTQNAGFSEIQGPALALQGDSNTVTFSDHGAVKSSFDFAGDALRESLKQVEIAGSNTSKTVGEAVKAVSESARAETENIVIQGMKWAVIAVAVWAGFQALGKMS